MDTTEVDEFLNRRTVLKISDRIECLLKEKRTEELVIAFCGIFSSGKSSLLNELLKQDFKLPTGGEPVTKFVTRIEYGGNFKAFYVSRGHPVYLTPNEVENLVRGKGDLPQNCQEIILQMPSEILKHNVVLLDTPGYDDSKSLEELTRHAVQSADMAVFCCNADHFGRMFEQSYFQELEDSIGNYLVVVNHSDVIHTDEEFDSLVEYVDQLVANRGKRKLSTLTDKTIFFTVGAGRYIDLDGLDQCLMNIVTSGINEIHGLKEYATTKRLNYQLKSIQMTVKDSIDQGHDIYSKTKQDLMLCIQQRQIEYETKCREVDRNMDLLKGYIRDLLHRKIDSACSAVEQLENDNQHQDFVDLSATILKSEFISLPGDINQWKEKKTNLNGKDMDIFSSNLMQLLDSYRVPSPVGELVKNRGIVGSFLVSAIDTVVLGIPVWDDGYDVEFHGYALAAKKNIRGTFLSRIKEIVNRYLEGLRETSLPEITNVDASILDRIDDQLRKWEDCRCQIEKSLEETNHILNKKANIVIMGSFGSGKHTLFNALLREEIVSVSDFIDRKFPTIVKSTEPDEEDRIVYEYPTYDIKGEQERIVVKPDDDYVKKELFEIAYGHAERFNETKLPVSRTVYSSRVDIRYSYCVLNYINMNNQIGFDNIGEKLVSKADALVFMISATEPLDKEGKAYIAKHFAGKQKENVFFVINKVNLLRSEEELEKLKAYIQDELRTVFLDKNGAFNKKLYDSRVFYVDAYGAMNTRLGRETPITRNFKELIPDEETGVPDLERSLYRFVG